jgi:hypothetical protein
MHKLILMMLLAVVSSSALAAEWIYVAKTGKKTAEADAFTAYADPTTIRKSGNMVKMWIMYDSKIATDRDLISARTKEEYDCKKKQRRVLFVSYYSEHMADGETVSILNERKDWQQVLPDSVAEGVLKFACRFRPELPQTFPSETFS